jgi:WD40 repeat protein
LKSAVRRALNSYDSFYQESIFRHGQKRSPLKHFRAREPLSYTGRNAMKKTCTASAIRHVATARDGKMVAVGLFERTVSIWNMATGRRMSEFETVLGCGGTQLTLSHEESACLAAGSHRGLACYDVTSGEMRWRRKDLMQIGRVVIAPDGRHAFCCCAKGPCHIFTVATGETTETLRGVREVWVDSIDGLRLQQSSTLTVVDRLGKKLFGITPSSFAVLDASFSHRYLAISESGSDVRIFELSSGREVARHVQPKNHHVLWLSAFPGGSLFHGVQWHYQTGGPRRLFRFRANASDPELIADLGEPAEVAFCRRGRHVLTSEGDLIDCRSGRTIGKLDFPQTEYPTNRAGETDFQLGFCKGLTRLDSLNLSEFRVRDAELKHLKELTALQSLDLSKTPVTDAGLKHLKELNTLQSLDLSGTKVTSAGVRKLRKALPRCSIRFIEE